MSALGTTDATKIAKAFFVGKRNSSVALEMDSKPAKAHGARTAMATISFRGNSPDAKGGARVNISPPRTEKAALKTIMTPAKSMKAMTVCT